MGFRRTLEFAGNFQKDEMAGLHRLAQNIHGFGLIPAMMKKVVVTTTYAISKFYK